MMHKPTLALRVASMLAATSAEALAHCGAAAEMMADDDVPSCEGYLSQANSAEARRVA
jgi:pimeloyl-CoA synthetase